MLQAFVKYISNQRKCDKFSIAYMIGMIDFNSCMRMWPEMYKRKELIEKLTELVQVNDNFHRLLASDNIRKQIENNMN